MACGTLHIRLRPYRELATWSQSSASVCTNPDKLFPSHGAERVLLRGQCPLKASHQSAQMPTQRWWLSICLEVLVSGRITYAIPGTPFMHHFSSSPPLLLLQPHPHPLVLLGSWQILTWVSCFLCLCAHLRPPFSCPESSLAWRWEATMQPASHMHVQLEVQARKWLKDHPRVMEERSVCSPFILWVLTPKAHFLRLLWSLGGIASVVGSRGQFLSTSPVAFFSDAVSLLQNSLQRPSCSDKLPAHNCLGLSLCFQGNSELPYLGGTRSGKPSSQKKKKNGLGRTRACGFLGTKERSQRHLRRRTRWPSCLSTEWPGAELPQHKGSARHNVAERQGASGQDDCSEISPDWVITAQRPGAWAE